MPDGVLGGLLGAGLAGLGIVLALTATDRPLTPGGQSLRIIAAAFAGGQATLGIVIALLSLMVEDATVPLPVAFASAAMLGAGGIGIGLIFRQAAASGAPLEVGRERSRLVLLMALADAVGVLGAVIALLALFVAPAG